MKEVFNYNLFSGIPAKIQGRSHSQSSVSQQIQTPYFRTQSRFLECPDWIPSSHIIDCIGWIPVLHVYCYETIKDTSHAL